MSRLSDIKIIFSDIDGTLLPVSGKDLGPTAELFSRLIRAGYTVIPCTGRGTGNIPPVSKNIPGVPALITANGALVVDRASGKYLREARVPMELSRKVLRFLRNYPGSVFCYRDGEHYVDNAVTYPEAPEGTTFCAWLAGAKAVDMAAWLEENPGPLDKMGFVCFDEAVKDRIMEQFALQPFGPRFVLSRSAFWNVEINMADATKGASAAWLLERLGFTPAQMLAAGDNLNDYSMLELAAVSVAPANAVPEVQKLVTYLVPDCKDDGVENFLAKLLDKSASE